MDHAAFDRIARLLGGASTRRRGIGAALAVLAGGAAASTAEAKPGHGKRPGASGRKPGPAGPCGPTGADNACKKDSQCCTGYCKKGKPGKTGRCRCIKAGKGCKDGQTCCGGAACANGLCTRKQQCTPDGGACTGETCCAGLTCRSGSCACTPNGQACTGQTCCGGDTCWNGTCQQPTKQVGEACTDGVDICANGSICRVLLPDAQTFTPPGTYCSLDTGLPCPPAGAPLPTTDCVGGWCSPTSPTAGICGIIDQVTNCTTSTDTCAGITGFGMLELVFPPVAWLCTVTVDNRPCRVNQASTYIVGPNCNSDDDCTTAGYPACVDFPASGSQCSYVGFTGLGAYCRDAQMACSSAGDCPAKPSLTPSCTGGYCAWS